MRQSRCIAFGTRKELWSHEGDHSRQDNDDKRFGLQARPSDQTSHPLGGCSADIAGFGLESVRYLADHGTKPAMTNVTQHTDIGDMTANCLSRNVILTFRPPIRPPIQALTLHVRDAWYD